MYNELEKLCESQVGVVANPDFHSFDLTDREHFIILGCDGLWGVCVQFIVLHLDTSGVLFSLYLLVWILLLLQQMIRSFCFRYLDQVMLLILFTNY
jgi:hypothetical protein